MQPSTFDNLIRRLDDPTPHLRRVTLEDFTEFPLTPLETESVLAHSLGYGRGSARDSHPFVQDQAVRTILALGSQATPSLREEIDALTFDLLVDPDFDRTALGRTLIEVFPLSTTRFLSLLDKAIVADNPIWLSLCSQRVWLYRDELRAHRAKLLQGISETSAGQSILVELFLYSHDKEDRDALHSITELQNSGVLCSAAQTTLRTFCEVLQLPVHISDSSFSPEPLGDFEIGEEASRCRDLISLEEQLLNSILQEGIDESDALVNLQQLPIYSQMTVLASALPQMRRYGDIPKVVDAMARLIEGCAEDQLCVLLTALEQVGHRGKVLRPTIRRVMHSLPVASPERCKALRVLAILEDGSACELLSDE